MSPFGIPIPRDATLIEITDSYGPLPEKVRCGREECGTRHGKGFVVAFKIACSDEVRAGAVGHICGKRNFGVDWTMAKRKFEAKARSEQRMEAARRFTIDASELLPELRLVQARLRFTLEIQRLIVSHAPQVTKFCQDAAKSRNDRLVLVTSRGEFDLHRLAAPSFWIDTNVLERAQVTQLEAERLLHYIESDDASTVEVERRIVGMADFRRRCKSIHDYALKAAASTTPEELSKVLSASNVMVTSNPHPFGSWDPGEWALKIRVEDGCLQVHEWRGRNDYESVGVWVNKVDLIGRTMM